MIPASGRIAAFGSIDIKTPLVLPGQRVGIMGGTFNPAHDGHRIVAETAVKRLRLDQLWWLVTPGNPLKSKSGLPEQALRMAAAKEFAPSPRMKITGFEAALGTPFTAATLAFLKRRYPRVRFVWVMGADNLASFDRWQQWRAIAGTFPLAIIDRPGWRLRALASPTARAFAQRRVPELRAALLTKRPPPAWVFLTSRLSPLSSTKLRDVSNHMKYKE